MQGRGFPYSTPPTPPLQSPFSALFLSTPIVCRFGPTHLSQMTQSNLWLSVEQEAIYPRLIYSSFWCGFRCGGLMAPYIWGKESRRGERSSISILPSVRGVAISLFYGWSPFSFILTPHQATCDTQLISWLKEQSKNISKDHWLIPSS